MTSHQAMIDIRRCLFLSQTGEAFLSSKHQDYQAVVAEFWSAVRA